jgi:hypothetical protein
MFAPFRVPQRERYDPNIAIGSVNGCRLRADARFCAAIAREGDAPRGTAQRPTATVVNAGFAENWAISRDLATLMA